MNLYEFFDHSREYYESKLEKKYPGLQEVMKKKEPVIIYGAAKMGQLFKKKLDFQQINVLAFADANDQLWGTKIDGTMVISPNDLQTKYFGSPVLVASLMYEADICENLKSMKLEQVFPLFYLNLKHPDIFVSPEYEGVFDSVFNKANKCKIRDIMEIWNDDISRMVFYNLIEFRFSFEKKLIAAVKSKHLQYFEPDIYTLSQNETMLDCGAYIGDTLKQFHEITSGHYNKVYSFEPDRYNFTKLQECAKNISPKKIIPINCGVYRTSGELHFSETGNIDTRITNDKNTNKLPVVSIDEFFIDKEPPTFIKMDIEGGETDALEGARNTISNHKPKLAIAVYHKAKDLWNIPLLILQINPEYKIYLRHYTNEITDTVCYAI